MLGALQGHLRHGIKKKKICHSRKSKLGSIAFGHSVIQWLTEVMNRKAVEGSGRGLM
jgi:hypothetical protein